MIKVGDRVLEEPSPILFGIGSKKQRKNKRRRRGTVVRIVEPFRVEETMYQVAWDGVMNASWHYPDELKLLHRSVVGASFDNYFKSYNKNGYWASRETVVERLGKLLTEIASKESPVRTDEEKRLA